MRRLLRELAAACTDPDTVQAAGAVLTLLVVGLIASWPRDSLQANDAWYGLAAARATALAAWGLLQGARDAGRPRGTRLPSTLALGVWGLLTVPLEWAAFVAAAPALPYAWVLATTTLLAWASYGLGWALARSAGAIRLRFVVPVLLPAAAAGIVWIDVTAGTGWITPWSVPRSPAAGALVTLGAASALTLGVAARGWLRPVEAT